MLWPWRLRKYVLQFYYNFSSASRSDKQMTTRMRRPPAYIGTRPGSTYCVCETGWLGSDCSIGGANSTAAWFYTSSGSKLIEFWVDASVNYLHVRFSFQPKGYFGIIFNPATDGMSGGDCWILSATSSTSVAAQDRWSANMRTPSYDTTQSLETVSGYVNSTNQVVYFKRALQNSDKYDKVRQFKNNTSFSIFIISTADIDLSRRHPSRCHHCSNSAPRPGAPSTSFLPRPRRP